MMATIVVTNSSNGHDNNNDEEHEYGQRLTLNISDGQQFKQLLFLSIVSFVDTSITCT